SRLSCPRAIRSLLGEVTWAALLRAPRLCGLLFRRFLRGLRLRLLCRLGLRLLRRTLLDDEHGRTLDLPDRLRTTLREFFGHRLAEIGRRFHGAGTGAIERLELVGRRALATGDDRAGMAHALA